uniref:N(6)-L-threonylcarbamoyladenine synthase n=2 Tax=Cacopsylla melanoneura TaxID=428564 RepID=A0A8D8RUY1_9HEMI
MLSRINSLSFFLLFPVLKRPTCVSATFFPSRNHSKFKILGIETSCDDTAAAVVDSDGTIHGEAHYSQQETHMDLGGINPTVAKELHKAHIKSVVNKALANANCTVHDLHAIAVTMKPGLALSLWVGMTYGKHLSATYNKPFIPIHHMEAHALTPRLVYKDLEFPFLVLLVSGGHCLLSYAKSSTEFYTLGSQLDDAPGEALDKVARNLKLRNLEPFRNMSGGEAIEHAARAGNPYAFEIRSPVLSTKRNCDFSFSGIKNAAFRKIKEAEEKHKVKASGVVPNYADISASFQYMLTQHICHRVQRALEFLDMENLIPDPARRKLVISGGVASNTFLFESLSKVCSHYEYSALRPSPALCTDNGVMIAWNGVELYRTNSTRIVHDPAMLHSVDIEPKVPFGEDWRQKVVDRNIRTEVFHFLQR